jgi:hypothetical protein
VIRRLRLPLAAAAAVALVVLPTSPCWACSCIQISPEDQAASSSAVFGGVVEEYELIGSDEFAQEAEATFAVDTVYKGRVPARVVVGTAAYSAACGVEFQEGGRYTVFVSGGEADGFFTDLCTATTRGDIDPAEFGLTATEVDPPPPPEGPATVPFVLAAVGVVLAGALVAWLVQRNRRGTALSGGAE